MNWAKVARYLDKDADLIRERAQSGFPNDLQTQREMRTRAAILESLALAIWDGLDSDERGHRHFINDKS
jgi:hypothetical protein